MRLYLIGWSCFFVTTITMCGVGDRVVSNYPAKPSLRTDTITITPLTSKVNIPVPNSLWSPIEIGDAKGEMLIRALNEKKKLGLVLPKSSDVQDLETRILTMVKNAAPETTIITGVQAVLDKMIDDNGKVPYRSHNKITETPARPFYLSKDNPLSAEWSSFRKKTFKDADAVLVVRPIRLSDDRLNDLSRAQFGGCDEFVKELDNALDSGALFFEKHEKEMLKILGNEFTKNLIETMPLWRAELSQQKSLAVTGSIEQKCVEAYSVMLDKYEPCLSGPCQQGPRVFSISGGVLGMIDETAQIPDYCPSSGMRNFAFELLEIGDQALLEVFPSMKTKWPDEMVRFRALLEIRKGIVEACLPKHRRIDENKAAAARDAVSEFLSDLQNSEFNALWERMRGLERVSGIGPVRVLARTKAKSHDPLLQTAALLRQIRELDRCLYEKRRVFQVSIIDLASSEVLYVDLFSEESLFCDGFLPR